MKRKVSHHLFHFSKWTLYSLLLFTLASVLLARLLLNNLNLFKEDIIQQMSSFGVRGFGLEDIHGRWSGQRPLILISNASLNLPGQSSALSINSLEIEFDIADSYYHQKLTIRKINASIEKLILVRDTRSNWWLNDIKLTSDSSSKQQAALDLDAVIDRIPEFLDLEIRLLQIRDLVQDQDYLIQHTQLMSSHINDEIRLDLSTRLPSTLGAGFRFRLSGNRQQQKAYVEAENLELVPFAELFINQQVPVQQLRLTLDSWIDFKAYQPESMITRAAVSGIKLNDRQTQNQARSTLKMQQYAFRRENGWQVDFSFSDFSRDGLDYPDFKAQLWSEDESAEKSLWVEKIDAGLLARVVRDYTPDESLSNLLEEMQPQGRISQLMLRINPEQPLQSAVSLDFDRVAASSSGDFPGFDGLKGSLVSSGKKAEIQLSMKSTEFDYPHLFRGPIPIEQLQASMLLGFAENSLVAQTRSLSLSNDDAAIDAELRLEIEQGQKPFMFLRAALLDANVAMHHRYLPVAIMHDSLIDWMDNSLQAGTIDQADVLFHGRLEPPGKFRERSSGVLHARLDVHDPTLKFLPDWPAINSGTGTLDFYNTRMQGDFTRVGFAVSKLDQLAVAIEDFEKAALEINIHNRSSIDSISQSLATIPILQAVADIRQQAERIEGNTTVDAQVYFPLTDRISKPLQVSAKAQLDSAGLLIPHWQLDFTGVAGELHLLNDRISATGLAGYYRSSPVTIDIHPGPETKQLSEAYTDFIIQGDMQIEDLVKPLPDFLAAGVDGASHWTINTRLWFEPAAEKPRLRVTAQSDLSGSSMRYPPPLSKPPQTFTDFSFSGDLFTDLRFHFQVLQQDRFKADGQLDLTREAQPLDWLNLSFGSSEPMALRQGISVNGTLQSFDLDQWLAYLAPFKQVDAAGAAEATSPLSLLNRVEVNVGAASLAGQTAHQAELKIDNSGNHLLIDIDSEEVVGRIVYPYEENIEEPIRADLQRLILTFVSDDTQQNQPQETQSSSVSVQDMPNVFLNSQVFGVNDMRFSDLILDARKSHNEFKIERLRFQHNQVVVQVVGTWTHELKTGQDITLLNMAVEGEQFGEAVKELGLGETLEGGSVAFNGQVGWSGTLLDINWPTLIGDGYLKLEDGILKNVEPGAGRFIGLLSLNALPKRLFLDFGDVVKDGMVFSEIKGGFVIEGENIRTKNARMESESASVKIKGSSNLRNQTYDQKMIIIPKIGETLPLIGAIVSGSSVGWGLLLLQQIFKKPIDKTVTLEYQVTGPWENPVIEPVKEEKKKTEK